MQQNSAQRLLANLKSVSSSVGGSVWQSVDVVLGGNGLESVQRLKESVGLAGREWDCTLNDSSRIPQSSDHSGAIFPSNPAFYF